MIFGHGHEENEYDSFTEVLILLYSYISFYAQAQFLMFTSITHISSHI